MVVRIQPDVVSGTELKAWGGAEVVCPNCRHVVPVSAAPVPCCPELRALLSPPPLSKCVFSFSPAIGPVEQLHRLESTSKALSISGWYRRALDWQGARTLLRDASPGAFLIRESAHSKFIFSLSVQTESGPTSVRLIYRRGLFQLDCKKGLIRLMPTFKCAVELVQYYVTRECEGEAGSIWVDAAGYPHSPVVLRSGLRSQPPSLAHAARLAIHRALAADRISPKLSTAPKYERLPLPKTLIDFLSEYPYYC